MSKKFWVEIEKWDKNIVTAALESGARAVLVPKGYSDKVKDLGVITTISEDGDLILGKDVFDITIESKADEEKALKLPPTHPVIIRTTDWRVIPLENLIAQRGNLIASVSNAEQAELALKVLEKGADGILLKGRNINEIKRTGLLLGERGERIELVKARIASITTLGMGDRVCIDTITNMSKGEGMLVGNSSGGMFLVSAENVETHYCATRPFRVNAGAVHAYIKVPGGKTAYLADLKTGDEVLIVSNDGGTRSSFVGRSKVERRPLMLVEAEYNGREISLVMQNAETIRLTRPDGLPESITHLKPGDEVLAHTEEPGRHFGIKVHETITER